MAGHKNPIDTVAAVSFTAIITLIMANCFPFLSFESQGQSRTISLLQVSTELFQQGFHILSILVFFFIILLPLLYLLTLLILVLPIKWHINRPAPIYLGRLISQLLPWTMAEVFIAGILVALIKVMAMAHIIFGISFWAYIMFAVMFIYVTSIVDNHRLWTWIEHGK